MFRVKKGVKIGINIIIEMSIIIIGLVVIQSQLFAFTTVYQWSMYQTLEQGDLLLTEKISYRFKEPEYGDIIIFFPDKPKGFKGSRLGIMIEDYTNKIKKQDTYTRYVKRVIGVAGDTISIKDGEVYVNHEKINESYALGKTEVHDSIENLVIPEGYVFVMGDNRESSLDSRGFGPIPIENIESKVIVKLWPHMKILK